MAGLSFLHKLATVALALTSAYAQSSTPTQSWTPGPTCSAGLSNIANNPSDLGGLYTDPKYSALWNIECAQGSTSSYYGTSSTNGQGIYACFKNCEKRIGCTGFSFTSSGTQTSRP